MRARIKIWGFIVVSGFVSSLAFNNCGGHEFGVDQATKVAELNASGGLAINNGDEFTKTGDVLLSIDHNSASEMYVSNSRDCDGGGVWEPLAKTKAWKLGQANSMAEVFIKFRESENDEAMSSCISDTIVHDSLPPVIQISKNVTGFINKADATIEFSVSDSGSGVENAQCANDGASSGPACSGKAVRTGLGEGPHSVLISAKDRAGNSAVPVLAAFTVDLTPPTLVVNSRPASVTNQTVSEFRFSASDALSGVDRYECRNGAAGVWAACVSPYSLTLSEGTQVVAIRAFDKAGNASAEQSFTWKIDLTAPTVIITKYPKPFSNLAASVFEFSGAGADAIVGYQCAVDSSALTACTSPLTTAALGEGSHTFSVVGRDAAGNLSAPAKYMWVIDLTGPVVTLASTPAKNSSSLASSFAFSATDALSGVDRIECQLDGSGYSACTSPSALTLAEGVHTYDVRAYDKAGNLGSAPSYQWRIDVTKPLIQITSGPVEGAFLAARTADLGFVGTDANGSGVASYECQLDSGTSTPCTSIKNLTGLVDGTHLFTVRAIDMAGNKSDPAASRSWKVDLTPPAISFQQSPAPVVYKFGSQVVKFDITDAGSGVKPESIMCGLGTQLVLCTLPGSATFTNQTVGSYTFTVKATDKLGNASTNSVSWVVTDQTMAKSQPISITQNKKVDVLVVIDNSGSMDYEQANMSTRFGTFIDQLAGLDWQIGIVTTDVSGDAALKDGRLVEIRDQVGKYVLTSAMPIATAKASFGATIQRKKSEGSGNEQGVGATVRAIQRSQLAADTVNAPNVALFRRDAALATIVVTDSDETNPSGTLDRNKPQFALDLVKSTWPGKAFSFNAIIVKPGDSACLAVNGNEAYGLSYVNLANLTGGILGSVCEADYGLQLKDIGTKTQDLIKSATLDCSPLDTDGDGKANVTITPPNGATAPSYVVDGSKITFATALPIGTTTLSYMCLKQ